MELLSWLHAFSSSLEDVLEHAPQLPGPTRLGLSEVDFGVFDSAFEHEQPVSYRLQLGPRHDELVLAEAELLTPPTGLVVTLATRLPAVQPGPAGAARRDRQWAPAPATCGLRHSDES